MKTEKKPQPPFLTDLLKLINNTLKANYFILEITAYMFPVSTCFTALCCLGLLCVEILEKLYFLSSSPGAPVLKRVIYLGGNPNPMPRKIIFKKYLGLEEESTHGFQPNMLW